MIIAKAEYVKNSLEYQRKSNLKINLLYNCPLIFINKFVEQ